MTSIQILKNLYNLSWEVMQYYIDNNRFDGVENQYLQIQDSKNHFGDSLFLAADRVLLTLDPNSVINEHNISKFRIEIALVNLTIFAYTLYNEHNQDYELCMNNYISNILMDQYTVSPAKDVKFYLELRCLCLIERLNNDNNQNLQDLVYQYFPVNLSDPILDDPSMLHPFSRRGSTGGSQPSNRQSHRSRSSSSPVLRKRYRSKVSRNY